MAVARCGRTALILALLLALPVGAQDSPAPDFGTLSSKAASGRFDADKCQQLAASFGDWVARQRDDSTKYDALMAGRKLGDALHTGCRTAIRDLEQATNEDEGALETLYRSELWYNINRALASLRYWQAWLDLGMAQQSRDEAVRVSALSSAERGFQAASLRILYPGLVYGSWLGLAYVAQLQDKPELMEHRLTLLQQALVDDPDNPLAEVVQTELTLLALRGRKMEPIRILPSEPLTAASAKVAEEQAFILLQQQRTEESGANLAAQYLRALIEQGYLDDRLFTRMLSYRDELTGRDIGPLGLLVDAEFAYGYQQYESNVLKFRKFLASPAVKLPLDLTLFHYHYAVSLHQIGLNRDAADVIHSLRSGARLTPALLQSLNKLEFIVAEALYQADPSSPRAAELRAAAQQFIAGAGSDPDVASAHMALARVSDDPVERQRHLDAAGADSRLRDSVRAVELETAVRDFQQAAAGGDADATRAAALAAQALLADMPAERRKSLELRVLAVQLDSITSEHAAELLARIDELSADPALDPRQKRILVWSRLRLLDRTGGLLAYVGSLGASGSDAAVSHELYPLLREFAARGRQQDVAEISRAWLPALAQQPQLQRQVRILQINGLRATGRDDEALAAIRDMLAQYPNSGDAWQLLADQSETMGDAFAAERALAHIAAAEPEGSPRWLDVSLHRLRLQARGALPGDDGCSLLQHIRVYDHRLDTNQQQALRASANELGCSGQGG